MNNNTDPRRHAQKQTFALVSQLKPRFNQRGISESNLWNAIKADLGVMSRSEIDERGYVRLAARLDAAKRHPKIFDEICRFVKQQRIPRS